MPLTTGETVRDFAELLLGYCKSAALYVAGIAVLSGAAWLISGEPRGLFGPHWPLYLIVTLYGPLMIGALDLLVVRLEQRSGPK